MISESQEHEYAEHLARFYDAPHHPVARNAMLVFGDMLQAHGDPRGELIALGEAAHAARMASDRAGLEALQAAIDALVDDHERAWLGAIAPLRRLGRALRLDWRGGSIHAAYLDTRLICKKRRDLEPHEVVALLLQAPASRHLRRLWIRVEHGIRELQVLNFLALIEYQDSVLSFDPPPLEELVVGPRQRPIYLGRAMIKHWQVGKGHHASNLRDSLLRVYPRLFLVGATFSVAPLPSGLPLTSTAVHGDLEPAEIMLEPKNRVMLGRALFSHKANLRLAALRCIARLGPLAESFLPGLDLMLYPRFMDQQPEVIACLDELGPVAAPLVPRLLSIAGRGCTKPSKGPDHYYSQEIRSAAGKVAAKILAMLER